MNRKAWIFLGVAGVLFGHSASAWAYQTVKIGPVPTAIYKDFTPDAPSVGTALAGSSVNCDDSVRGGRFKCTTSAGVSGWILASAIASPAVAVGPEKGVSPARGAAPKAYVGALGGYGVISGGSALTFGMMAGYKFAPMWGVGGYFSYGNLAASSASTDVSPASSNSNSSVFIFAAELNYYVPGDFKGLYIGPKLGVALLSSSASATGTSGTVSVTQTSASGSVVGLAVGGAIGYDYEIVPTFALGAQANAFYVSGSIGGSVIDGLLEFKFQF